MLAAMLVMLAAGAPPLTPKWKCAIGPRKLRPARGYSLLIMKSLSVADSAPKPFEWPDAKAPPRRSGPEREACRPKRRTIGKLRGERATMTLRAPMVSRECARQLVQDGVSR